MENTNIDKNPTTQILTLLLGEYKTGKTVSAATFPKPMLFLDFDKGFTSVQTALNKDGSKVVKDPQGITVMEFFKEGFWDLDFKTPLEKGGGGQPPKHVEGASDIIQRLNQTLRSLYTTGEVEIKGEKKGPFQTLVVDNLTTMFRIWKEMILHMNRVPNLRIQDYGTLEHLLLGQFIPSLKQINKKIPYIILIDHVMMDKDEISGRISEFPVGPSINMGKGLGKEFDEIWIQRIEGGEYIWRTKRDGLLQAGSRLSLPEVIKPATFQTLDGILKGRK